MKRAHLYIALFAIASNFANFTYCEPNLHAQELSKEYVQLASYYEQHSNQNKAQELYAKAIELDKTNLQAHAKLGSLLYLQNNILQASEYLQIACKLDPDDPHLHFNLGQCYVKQKFWRAAFSEFQQTVSLDPKHERAYIQLGAVCEKLNQTKDAARAYEKAIEINPNLFDAHHALGNLFRNQERIENAIVPYRKALELQPNNLHVLMDLANSLNMLGHDQESLELYETIVQKNPNILAALYNFGFTLKKMGHLEKAKEVYHQVLAKKPDYSPVHFSLSTIYLAQGDYKRGWDEYEWRWRAYNEEPQKYNRPLWGGEDLVGRTLLVHAEQGLGDTLQFIRYLKVLKEQSKHITIIFQSQEPLITLMRQLPYIDQVISRTEQPGFFHYHIPLMSIPRVMETRVNTIPVNTPYISPSEDLEQKWHEKLSKDKNFKIGICWQGNARYSTQSLRRAVALKSIALDDFAPLFEIPGVSLYCLQRVDGIDQIQNFKYADKLHIFDSSFDQTYGRFMDTAAVMKNLDLVVSVDTGTCHLAAAMNVPTWILLPAPADWRWLLNRQDSPWYPTVKLFRQKEALVWKPVIEKVALEVQRIISNSKPKLPRRSKRKVKTFEQQPTIEQLQFFEELAKTI